MKKIYGLMALLVVISLVGVEAQAKMEKAKDEEVPLVRCRKCAKRNKCTCRVNLRRKKVRLGDDCVEYIAKHGHAKNINCPHEPIAEHEEESSVDYSRK